MVEIENLLGLLNADYVMSHQLAAELSGIACDVKDKCPNLAALSIVGSTVNGGAVMRSILEGIDPRVCSRDIDFGAVLYSQMGTCAIYPLNCYIIDELRKRGLNPCETFNALNFHLVADSPFIMAQRMLDDKRIKSPVGACYVAERLLIPYGVVFPLSETKKMQQLVEEGLGELEKIDPEFKDEVINQMKIVQSEKRKIKDKHVPNQEIRKFLESNRLPSSIHF